MRCSHCGKTVSHSCTTSAAQQANQAIGPHRPSAKKLRELLEKIPGHHEIEAIAINGQTGVVLVETSYEGLSNTYKLS